MLIKWEIKWTIVAIATKRPALEPNPKLGRLLVELDDDDDDDVVVQQGFVNRFSAVAQRSRNQSFYKLVNSKVNSYYSSTSFLHKNSACRGIYQHVLSRGGNFYRYWPNDENIPLYSMDQKDVIDYIKNQIRYHKKTKNPFIVPVSNTENVRVDTGLSNVVKTPKRSSTAAIPSRQSLVQKKISR